MRNVTESPSALSEISPQVVGRQLRLARNSLDLTLNNVSRQLGLVISAVSDIELGKRRVSGIELVKFSRLYGRPLDFFLRTSSSGNSFSALMRSLDETSVSKETIIRFQDLCHNYRFLRDLLKVPTMPSPPDYSPSQPNWTHAEEIAEAERVSLGLNGQPIRDISDLLETKRGVKIFHLPENPDKFFGAYVNDDACGACFLINAKNPLRRRTFTIAHEYAHCIAHKDRLAHIDYRQTFEDRNQHERFANAFAAAFLMPRGAVVQFLNQLSSSQRGPVALTLIQLANYFGVSLEAAGWRLVSLRKLAVDKWKQILGQRIPSTPLAKFLGYDKEDAEPEMLPRHYRFLCYEAYAEKLISFERLAELLHRNFHELKSEFGAAER